MPVQRLKSNKRKAGPESAGQLSKKVEPCVICGKVMSRESDVKRHMKIHVARKLSCPWEGCDFSAHQKSNLNTHLRRHTGDKSNICTDDPECKFESCDPASLLRHRKQQHGYIPKTRKLSMAPTHHASIDSSFSPASTLPLPYTSSPSSFFPFGESGTTCFSPNTYSLNNSESNNYASAWDIPEFTADFYTELEEIDTWLKLVTIYQ